MYNTYVMIEVENYEAEANGHSFSIFYQDNEMFVILLVIIEV